MSQRSTPTRAEAAGGGAGGRRGAGVAAGGWGVVWLRLCVGGGQGRAAGAGWLVGPLAVVLVAAVGAGVGAGWLVEGRYVRHTTTTEPAPAGGQTGPVAPAQVGWRRPD